MLAEMNSLEIKKAFRKGSSIPVFNRWITGVVRQARTWGLNRLAYSYRLAMVLVVLILSGGFFTLNASASSQPGDLLYTLKLGLERAGLVVPEQVDLPQQVPVQFGLEKGDNWIWAGQIQEIQEGGLDPLESFPGSEQGAIASAGARDNLSEQPIAEEDKDLREAEKEAEKDLRAAEKEEEKDLRETEKEVEKDEKDLEKEVDKVLKDLEKDLKESDKDKDK